ncbi:MDR family MFS transporter [Streptomyces europaeiscabiei]|uniref:MDR family MFS transporter n=1 Tax=Streptomyces europaeiscabiei TaxID=146819 RepID=UPI0029AF5C54|nr:MDR family MFS transporter [Streptomyces europaeiscabiei]MDX3691333.1 MDR family MFS transporter [Streptomyces europaeiscabiei]
MAEESSPTESAEERVERRNLYAAVVAALLAMLLGALDSLIVGTAMPQVVGELGGVDRLSWVVTVYLLAIAVSTPVWGKLGDMFGRKGAFMVTVVVFVAGSMLCGAAQDMNQLIAFRLLQGVGGGGLMVGALALVGTLIPPREQGRYQGFMSAVMGLAMVSGPLVGGVITDSLGWRWCFYVNLPVGAVALLLIAGLRLPRSPRTGARVDYPGALLLTVAISAVVLVTTWGGKEYAWTSLVLLGLAAVGVAACAALLVVERRAAAPMLPLTLFKSANFSLITLVGVLLGAVMTSAVTFLPILGQSARGTSATGSGLLLLPMFAAQVAVGLVAGRFITATGKYKIVVLVGGVFMALGTLLLGTAGAGAGAVTQGACMAALGVGMGLLTQTTVLVSLQSSPVEDLGAASATATLARTLGGSLGVAVSGAFFARALGDAGPDGDGAPLSEGGAALDPAVLDGASGAARAAYQDAVLDGTTQVFLFTAVLAVVALAAAFLLKEVPLRGAPTAEGDTPDEDGTAHASAPGTKEVS